MEKQITKKNTDVENLYIVDVPEFEENEISYAENKFYDEVEVNNAVESNVDIEV